MDNINRLTDGFLGDEPTDSLDKLQQVLTKHVLPFVSDWWDPEGPVPTKSEIQQLIDQINERTAHNPLPDPYAHVPELLKKLSASMRFNRNNYFNVVPSPFIPASLASFIVSLQNPNNIVQEVSGPTWEMEKEPIAWLGKNLFGIDEETGAWGNVVSGGTAANMTAMLMARDYTYDKLNRPRPRAIGARGLMGYKPGVVIGTTATHYSVKKALWFLGMGSENLITVPVALDERVKVETFKEERFIRGIRDAFWREKIAYAIEVDKKDKGEELQCFYEGAGEPFSLQPLNSEVLKQVYSCHQFNIPLVGCVLTLGTTDTGTLERLDDEVLDILKDEDIYMHADAAAGGFCLTLDSVRAQTNDLANFDSFTVDAHKMGLVPYACGAVLFRDNGFREQIRQEAPYVSELAPTLEGSRAGTGSAALWMATRTIDVAGYQALLATMMQFTDHLRLAFLGSSFQVLHVVQMNYIAVAPRLKRGETRLQANRLVELVRADTLAQGKFMINIDKGLAGIRVKNVPSDESSDLVDIYALRIVVTNPLVDLSDAALLVSQLDESLDKVRYGARAMARR